MKRQISLKGVEPEPVQGQEAATTAATDTTGRCVLVAMQNLQGESAAHVTDNKGNTYVTHDMPGGPVEFEMQMVDVTAFGDTEKYYISVPGLKKAEPFTISGWWDGQPTAPAPSLGPSDVVFLGHEVSQFEVHSSLDAPTTCEFKTHRSPPPVHRTIRVEAGELSIRGRCVRTDTMYTGESTVHLDNVEVTKK